MRLKLRIEFLEDEQWLGGSIYIDNLLAALSSMPVGDQPDTRLVFLSSGETALARRMLRYPVLARQAAGRRAAGLMAHARRLHRAILRRAPALGAFWPAARDTVYFPAFDASQRWRTNLYWVPDFQIFHFPELFSAEELATRTRSIGEIAATQGVLLLSSHAALTDFRRFFPDATVVPRVWSFCSSIAADELGAGKQILESYGVPEHFVYVANHFWKHKDHETAFRALKILKDRKVIVRMVCTGLQSDRRDPGYYDRLVRSLTDWGIADQVTILGLVPRDHQIELFRAASLVLQPSLFEGWSTVIEDAKALGRPILASDIAVHKEQLNDLEQCHLFRAADANDMAERIEQVLPGSTAGPCVETERAAADRRDAARVASAHAFVAIANEAAGRAPKAG
ncbi:glycosyltransferase [Rhizobium fabae]|uniref:Glycosyltransferase n=2 Tax=Rhizobium fabae TaxID=573179 RepID=A0A7W6BGV8_9HYPH|nr:glycosyltransferase [Rhizobium fabae]MBB3918902.1 glycosyltransferase involved in cell wall biosynthesis [Rhizobium fabae]RUM07696.1 glycosyltransferase [Rhizobium fabae]